MFSVYIYISKTVPIVADNRQVPLGLINVAEYVFHHINVQKSEECLKNMRRFCFGLYPFLSVKITRTFI